MRFTKQDLLTFGIGLLVSLVLVAASALQDVDATTDYGVWLRNLVPALLTSLGRYIATYISQKVVTG